MLSKRPRAGVQHSGAAGVVAVRREAWAGVPPAGIEGVELNDQATNRDDCWCYGALGVGGTKMKVRKASVKALFTRSDAVLDIEQVYDLAKQIG